MLQFNKCTVAFVLATSVMALECVDGPDKKSYDAGSEQGQLQFDAAWSYVNNRCSAVQDMYDQVKAAGPGKSAPPCQVEGFAAGLAQSKTGAREECPETPEGCSNVDTYKAGMEQVKLQWDASFKFAGCDKIDAVMQITSESGPTEPPCLQMGFQDQLYLSFTTAGETCGGTTCQSRGEAIAQEHWENTVFNIGSDCAKADQILTQSLGVAPATPKCINEAFVAKIQALYTNKFDSCVVECQGHGQEYGVRLGRQFCSLADLFADDEGESLVVTICKQEEQDACEFELEGYALENCQSNYYDSKNDEYYQQLKAGCSITIGPDQPTNSPSPKPKPDPKCADEGKALGEDAWTQARRQVGDTCHDIDMAFADVSKAAPTKPVCQYEAYLDAVSDMYMQAQESCINECEGYGETRGQNAADQFCRVTALFSDDEGEEITIFVCNEKEKKACYAAFDARVEDTAECSERLDNADSNTKDFYDEVQEVCEISIGPDQ